MDLMKIPIHSDEFIVGEDSFNDIVISSTKNNKGFWYFTDSTNRLIKKFILERSKQVDRVCEVKLIRKGNDRHFTPRFCFYIFNKTKKTEDQYIKEVIDDIPIKARVDLGACHDNFKELLEFIFSLDDIDFRYEEYSVYSGKKKEEIKRLLNNPEASGVIKAALDDENITKEDIVNTGYRKAQLKIFKQMLGQKIREKDWQYFFNENQWIFGYGLDYRFNGVIQKEFTAGDPNGAGKDAAIVDFLLSDNNFTVFVETKLPDTKLFKNTKNRSGAWRLSNDLTDATSQVLEQKARGQIKLETTEQYGGNGNKIKQKSYDSKVILIIGSWSEIGQDTDEIKKIKRKTFELFRRDSRNIEIITYDELYERAKFIVRGGRSIDARESKETEIDW